MVNNNDVMFIEEMNWKQIDGLDRNKTIFFLPISIIEEHGPHLPVGMDFLVSKDLAIETIKFLNRKKPELTYVLLPAVPLGHCKTNKDFPGTISVSGKVIKDVVYGIGSSLGGHGFKYLIIFNWHLDFTHLKGIYQGMKKIMSKYDMRVYEPTGPYFWNKKIDLWDVELKKQGVDFNFDPEEQFHAGFRETSLMKYRYPYLVDEIHKKLPHVYVDLMSRKSHGKTFKELGLKDGYVGSPSNANEEYGKLYFWKMIEVYTESVLALYEGKELLDMPRFLKLFMKLPF